MKKYNIYSLNKAFTLIELIVSITIFSIIMVSVIMIFISASQVSAKIDISRSMQENTKNIVETIGKDLLDHGIYWVSKQTWASDCNFSYSTWKYRNWDKLCLWDSSTGYEYFLAIDSNSGWIRVEQSSIQASCSSIISECVLVRKNKNNWDITRLSNSSVYFSDLSFSISNENISKVTINFTMKPSAKKWIAPWYIKNSQILFQTTLSERLISTK